MKLSDAAESYPGSRRPDNQTMKLISRFLVLIAALYLVAGCATRTKDSAQSGLTATCHVCRYNNDLACVNIQVKDTTPHTDFQGTTYYFCSEDCRESFLKNPQKYLPKPKKP